MKLFITSLMLIIAMATLALMKSDSDYMRNVYEKILGYINQKQTQERLNSEVTHQKAQQKGSEFVVDPPETKREIRPKVPPISTELSSSKVIIALKEISFSGDKVDYIRKNLHSIPSDLRLSEVTSMLELIAHSSDKVKAVELLKNKISRDYSDKEYSDFMKTIAHSSDKVKATDILHGK